jgi:hypothetical protein
MACNQDWLPSGGDGRIERMAAGSTKRAHARPRTARGGRV